MQVYKQRNISFPDLHWPVTGQVNSPLCSYSSSQSYYVGPIETTSSLNQELLLPMQLHRGTLSSVVISQHYFDSEKVFIWRNQEKESTNLAWAKISLFQKILSPLLQNQSNSWLLFITHCRQASPDTIYTEFNCGKV